jgi:hypothetical protein
MKEIITVENIDQVLSDASSIINLKSSILNSDIVIVKKAISKQLINEIKAYLIQVGRSSFPNYERIEYGAKDFHRINNNDSRAYVKGAFHQFVFYPWNQNYFDLYNAFSKPYKLKNILSGIEEDAFMAPKSVDNFTARIAFQFYPQGIGYLNNHADPVDQHQIAVPILVMSEKGNDFKEGGAYVKYEGEKVFIEDHAEIGDVVFFKASLEHGVDKIDSQSEASWLDFKGRWMGLLAVNQFFNANIIAESVELNKETK